MILVVTSKEEVPSTEATQPQSTERDSRNDVQNLSLAIPKLQMPATANIITKMKIKDEESRV